MIKVLLAWVAVLTLIPSTTIAGDSSAAGLLGKWQAFAQEKRGKREEARPGVVWTLELQKGGKLIHSKGKVDKARRLEGSWKVDGDKLVTVIEGQTKTNVFKREGNKLVLSPVDRPDWRIHLVRLQ